MTSTDNKGTVLVLIPAYNAEVTIKESILSVLNQTYKTLIVIVIDDSSTDNTNMYASSINDNRLRILKLPINCGTYQAINYGLASSISGSTFDFYTIHGADDVMCPDKIKIHLEKLSPPFLASMAGFRRIDYHSKSLVSQNLIGHSMIIYNKMVFKRLGYFDPTRYGGDSEYYERFLAAYSRRSLISINKILTDAYLLTDNLTKKIPEASELRYTYMKQYRRSHVMMKKKKSFYVAYNGPPLP